MKDGLEPEWIGDWRWSKRTWVELRWDRDRDTAGGKIPLFLLFSATVAALGKWQPRIPCFLLPLEVLGQ